MKNKNELAKIFAGILRDIAKQNDPKEVNTSLLKYLSRKELVQILSVKFKGSLPKHLDLIEMENEVLLDLIGNDLFVVNYFSGIWCAEIAEQVPISKAAALEQGVTQSSSKSKSKDAKAEK